MDVKYGQVGLEFIEIAVQRFDGGRSDFFVG